MKILTFLVAIFAAWIYGVLSGYSSIIIRQDPDLYHRDPQQFWNRIIDLWTTGE